MPLDCSENHFENRPASRVVVIGIGNMLLKDEGIGVHTVKALQGMDLPPEVKIIDGGTAPDLITFMEAGDKLIIIDAARGGGKPGTIYRLLPRNLVSDGKDVTSLHEMGVAQNLKLMAMTDNEPAEIVIIGVEPGEIDWGMELSVELKPVVPEIVKTVLREIKRMSCRDRTGQVL